MWSPPERLGVLQPHLAAGWGKALLQEVVTRHQNVFQCLPQRKFLCSELMLSSPKEGRSAGEQGAGDWGEILPAAPELTLTLLQQGLTASLHFL